MKKMARKLAALLTALVLLMSFTLLVFAENSITVTLNIDLRGYENSLTGLKDFEDDYTAQGNTLNTLVYEVGGTAEYLALELDQDSEKPVRMWEINGEKYGPLKDYTDDENEGEVIYFSNDEGDLELYFTTEKISFFVSEATSNQTWTIKPIVESSGFKLTAKSAEETQGSAQALIQAVENSYELRANALPGYSFDHWLVESTKEEIKENPYIVTLTADETYTAYFREWKQATVSSDPEGLTAYKGGGDAVIATRKLDDTWTLEAKTVQSLDGINYAFSHWSCDGNAAFNSEEATIDVTLTENQHYVAHYIPYQITGIRNVRLGSVSTLPRDEAGSKPLIAGTNVSVHVGYDLNGHYPDRTVEVYSGDQAAVEAGTATLLAKHEENGSAPLSAFKLMRAVESDPYSAEMEIASWPAGVEKVTAVAYTEGYEKHYCTIDVQTISAAAGLDLSYLTSPRNCRTSYGGDVTGPDIYGAAAFQNADTGAMEIYVAGIGGVYQYVGSSGTTDFVRMPGMEDLNTSGDNLAMISCAFGVGGTADDLTSLVKVYHSLGGDQGGTVSYEVRWYDAAAGKWVTKSTIPPDKRPSINSGINKVLILSSDEIWTTNAYYDGTDWTLHGFTFDTFEKVNSTTAYATATNGKIYKLNTTRNGVSDSWTEVNLGGKLLGSRYDGALAVQLTDDGYAILDAAGNQTATYPQIDSSILGDVWTPDGTYKANIGINFKVTTVGFGGDGEVYALIYTSARNYVARADETGWTLMDTVEAFDIGGTVEEEKRPTSPTRIASLSEGVSLLYGDKGSLYLQAKKYTVSFNSNGGSDVSPISGQAWSSFIMPIPTQSGKSFAGWYSDAELTQLYANPVIPAANLTLYAKWTDASSDRWAEDRAKALTQLDEALSRMDQTDYSMTNWDQVLIEYENGKYRIAIADPQPASDSESDINKAVQDTIYAALNTAIDRMNAIPVQVVKPVQVVVSLDAQTLGLGYMIKPTLVTIPKYTQASVVITNLIKQTIKEKYGLDLQGYQTYHESEPTGTYAYMNTGTVMDSFYLAQVYWPDQENATIAQYIRDACEEISDEDIEKDRMGKYLGEFDYYTMSGWMYSISNIKDEELPSFPGVGAAGWRMRDGEVMRWQFTVWGYGADLNADNSAWGQASITGNSGDKTDLTYQIAVMREAYKDASEAQTYQAGDDKLETSRIYVNVFENVLCDPLATDEALNAAVEDLKLVGLELDNADTLSKVAGLVREIGTVTAESGDAIQAARKAYDALGETLRPVFDKAYPELIEALINAENAYKQIQDEEAAKQAAAAVDELIEALPDPEKISRSDKEALDEALKAYENLSDAAKQYVTKYNKLVACKAAYDKLVNTTPVTPSKPSTSTPTEPADTVRYTDVAKSDWFYDSVLYVSEKGLMTGTGANSFSPNVSTTRGMIVTILARLEGVDTTRGGTWYEAGQKWAMENGISDGTNMTGEMTREQLATILYRYAEFKGYDVSKSNSLGSFTDSGKVSDWALEAMQWANAEGLINGKGAGLLDPQGKATRAETAAILMRFMKNVAKLDD